MFDFGLSGWKVGPLSEYFEIRYRLTVSLSAISKPSSHFIAGTFPCGLIFKYSGDLNPPTSDGDITATSDSRSFCAFVRFQESEVLWKKNHQNDKHDHRTLYKIILHRAPLFETGVSKRIFFAAVADIDNVLKASHVTIASDSSPARLAQSLVMAGQWVIEDQSKKDTAINCQKIWCRRRNFPQKTANSLTSQAKFTIMINNSPPNQLLPNIFFRWWSSHVWICSWKIFVCPSTVFTRAWEQEASNFRKNNVSTSVSFQLCLQEFSLLRLLHKLDRDHGRCLLNRLFLRGKINVSCRCDYVYRSPNQVICAACRAWYSVQRSSSKPFPSLRSPTYLQYMSPAPRHLPSGHNGSDGDLVIIHRVVLEPSNLRFPLH